MRLRLNWVSRVIHIILPCAVADPLASQELHQAYLPRAIALKLMIWSLMSGSAKPYAPY